MGIRLTLTKEIEWLPGVRGLHDLADLFEDDEAVTLEEARERILSYVDSDPSLRKQFAAHELIESLETVARLMERPIALMPDQPSLRRTIGQGRFSLIEVQNIYESSYDNNEGTQENLEDMQASGQVAMECDKTWKRQGWEPTQPVDFRFGVSLPAEVFGDQVDVLG